MTITMKTTMLAMTAVGGLALAGCTAELNDADRQLLIDAKAAAESAAADAKRSADAAERAANSASGAASSASDAARSAGMAADRAQKIAEEMQARFNRGGRK